MDQRRKDFVCNLSIFGHRNLQLLGLAFACRFSQRLQFYNLATLSYFKLCYGSLKLPSVALFMLRFPLSSLDLRLKTLDVQPSTLISPEALINLKPETLRPNLGFWIPN